MNEQDYMKVTGKIDEKFVAEYQETPRGHVTSIRRKITIGIVVAAAVSIMVPVCAFALTQLTHREKVSVFYSEEGVQQLEESLLANGYTVENGQIRLTVDVEICDGNYVQGVYTLTALTEDAKAHLETKNNKLVYADTGEWIYPVGGGSEASFGEALGDDEISMRFSYPVNNAYIDNSRPIRLVFFEDIMTGEIDGEGNIVVEDYTYYEGICFDLLTEANIPTKTLRSEDGNEITLTPYGVSQLDEDWVYPENDEIIGIPINSVVVISTDGERIEILSDYDNSPVRGLGTAVANGIITTGAYGSGNFSIGFGTVLNVDNISGVEINGVVYNCY